MASANFAIHAGFNVAPAFLEFDFLEGHEETVGAKLACPMVVIEIDIMETGPPALIADRLTTGLDCIPAKRVHLALGLAPFIAAVIARPAKVVAMVIAATGRQGDLSAQ